MFSPKSTIYQVEWLDLVFANRNKSYGAYELRLNSDRRLLRSLLIATVLVLAAISYPVLEQWLNKADAVEPDTTTITVDLSEPPVQMPKEQPREAPAPAPARQPERLQTTRFVDMTVVSHPVAEEVPTIDQLQNSVIGPENLEGDAVEGNVNATSATNGNGSGLGDGITEGSGNEPVSVATLEIYPEFDGGMEGFARYLRKNLRYPAQAQEAGIGGKVILSFIIEKDGKLTDIKVLRGLGYGCDEEAIRVLKKSPAWKAGFQNGRAVRVLYTLPLVFQFGE